MGSPVLDLDGLAAVVLAALDEHGRATAAAVAKYARNVGVGRVAAGHTAYVLRRLHRRGRVRRYSDGTWGRAPSRTAHTPSEVQDG